MKTIHSRITFMAGLMMAQLFVQPALAESIQQPLITMNGRGEVTAVPDMAIVNIGIIREAKTADKALAANNAAMTQVLGNFKQLGIADKDLQTSQFNVSPVYQHNQPQQVIAYRVSNVVSVIVRKLDMLGIILDSSVKLGSNQINGVQFSITNLEELRDDARKQAFADAKRKATLYATEAAIKLGAVQRISESGYSRPPQPMALGTARYEAVPIARGEQVVQVTVQVQWKIDQ